MKIALNRYLCAAIATAIAATTAVAQTHHVARSKIETGPWTLTPIYIEDNGVTGAVVSFLALADPSAIVGDNIVAVWYQREASGWTAKSWETTDPWEAIKSVKQAMMIPDDEDERWGIPGSDASLPNAEQPKDYASGVLADDPLATLVATSPDRDAIVDLLASFGYKAADLAVDKGAGSCGSSELLTAYASGMEADLARCEAIDKATSAVEAIRASLAASCPDGLASLEANTAFLVASVQESTCDRPTLPLPPWVPVRCTTDRAPYPQGDMYCWTYERTYTVTRTRIKGKFNNSPPPTYLFCTQTSTATRTDTQTCCSPRYTTPVPGSNPDCEDLVTPPPTPGSPGAPTCSPVNSTYPLEGGWSPNPCSWVP